MTLWINLLVLGLVGFCLSGPTARIDHVVHRYLFVLDITESMGVEDMHGDGKTLTRLDKTKRAIRLMLERLHCDSEIALAIFTEHRSFLLVTPVTICDNFDELDNIIEHIDWHMAWRSQSEIAKGISSAINIAGSLDTPPNVVFFTDGHESPPIHPQLRFTIKNGAKDRWGLIVGVGGDKPRPIPRFSGTGKKLGYWHADDVDQVDRFTAAIEAGKSMTGVGPNPELTGKEHLSSLRPRYLRLLADEALFEYHRLGDEWDLADILLDDGLGEVVASRQDLRPRLLLLSLLLFLAGFVAQIDWFAGTKRLLRERNATHRDRHAATST